MGWSPMRFPETLRNPIGIPLNARGGNWRRDLVFPGFAEPEHFEVALLQSRVRARLAHRQHRGVDRFVGQLKRAEMHADAAARAEVLMRANCLNRIDMLLTHEPARFISADRQQSA